MSFFSNIYTNDMGQCCDTRHQILDEKYPYLGSQLMVVIYSKVSIGLQRELILEQFQRALAQGEFPSLRLLPGRSGIAAAWTRSGWRMLGGLHTTSLLWTNSHGDGKGIDGITNEYV